jgi:hypothetical protein
MNPSRLVYQLQLLPFSSEGNQELKVIFSSESNNDINNTNICFAIDIGNETLTGFDYKLKTKSYLFPAYIDQKYHLLKCSFNFPFLEVLIPNLGKIARFKIIYLIEELLTENNFSKDKLKLIYDSIDCISNFQFNIKRKIIDREKYTKDFMEFKKAVARLKKNSYNLTYIGKDLVLKNHEKLLIIKPASIKLLDELYMKHNILLTGMTPIISENESIKPVIPRKEIVKRRIGRTNRRI